LRLADVQQPNSTLTCSSLINLSASRAKTSSSDLPSAITASIRWPSRPPCALISSMASRVASTTGFSLADMVPVSECSMPTRIGGGGLKGPAIDISIHIRQVSCTAIKAYMLMRDACTDAPGLLRCSQLCHELCGV